MALLYTSNFFFSKLLLVADVLFSVMENKCRI